MAYGTALWIPRITEAPDPMDWIGFDGDGDGPQYVSEAGLAHWEWIARLVILGISGRKGMSREGLNALRGGVCRLIGVFSCDCLAMRMRLELVVWSVQDSSVLVEGQ